MSLNTCAKTLCFNKYPKNAFLRKERDLRLATKYEIEAPTVLEILMFYMRLVKYACSSSGESFLPEVHEFLKDVNSMGYDLCKSLLIDANLLKYKPSVLAASIVFLCFQLQFEHLLKNQVATLATAHGRLIVHQLCLVYQKWRFTVLE